MVAPKTMRASGQTTAEEETREQAKELTEQVNPELPDERERSFQTPGFARLRLAWNGPEQQMVSAMHTTIENQIREAFADAYELMEELYDLVRDFVFDPESGEPVPGADGLPQYVKTASGRFAEDWSRLTFRQRERFLFQLTTRLFDWEQRATEAWAESMFAKVNWEQAFANGFESIEGRATVDDRNARGKISAREEHYLAIFKTYYSKRADAIVRNMSLLAQRIKDVHITNGSR